MVKRSNNLHHNRFRKLIFLSILLGFVFMFTAIAFNDIPPPTEKVTKTLDNEPIFERSANN